MCMYMHPNRECERFLKCNGSRKRKEQSKTLTHIDEKNRYFQMGKFC